MFVGSRKLHAERSVHSIDESVEAVHRVTYFAPLTLTSVRKMFLTIQPGSAGFPAQKIRRAGLHEAFDGAVLIYFHKEHGRDDVEGRDPADRYVLVDDKIRILTAIRRVWGKRATTMFPRQGHYALDHELVSAYPPADYSIDRIGKLVNLDFQAFYKLGRKRIRLDFARQVKRSKQQGRRNLQMGPQ
jgi:hypothetical protein